MISGVKSLNKVYNEQKAPESWSKYTTIDLFIFTQLEIQMHEFILTRNAIEKLVDLYGSIVFVWSQYDGANIVIVS